MPDKNEMLALPFRREPDKVNRLNDRFVKYLFGAERNKPLLIDFINDALLTV